MTIDRSRIDEENELRLAWHEPDLAHTLDVVGPGGRRRRGRGRRGGPVQRGGAVVGGGHRRHPLRPLPRRGRAPHDTIEKIDDVAALNALTGANRTVSLHVPWDDPGRRRRRRAAGATPRRGASASTP